jgi:membrane-associated phospholipid phosphatase
VVQPQAEEAPPRAYEADAVEPLREARQYHSLKAWAKAVDLAVYRRFRTLGRTEQTVDLARRFSALGEHGLAWYALGVGGALLDTKRSDRWIRATLVTALAYGTSSTIKVAIGRKRPAVEDLPHLMETPTGLSFPSSHSSSSFAAARAFGCLMPKRPLYAAAATMAFTRLYLGVHYPSDIAAGIALGDTMGRLCK